MQSTIYRIIVLTLGLLPVMGTVSALAADAPAPTLAESAPGNLGAVAAEMQKEVEALRGWAFKHPVDVGLYTEAEMRAFISAPLEQSEAGGKEKLALGELGHKMIGLIPRDADLAAETEKMFTSMAPPGIYNHLTKELRVLQRADGAYGSLSVCLTLVHELTHALDDQHFDLAKLQKNGGETSDIENVWGAVVEGSAVTVQERFRSVAARSGKFPPVDLQTSMAEAAEQMQSMTGAPPYAASFFARFPCGVRFLQRGSRALRPDEGNTVVNPFELQGVGDAVQTAAARLPRSSEQILHPEKYWQSERRDEPVVIDDQTVEKLTETAGLRVIARDTLGELLCAVVTSPADKKVNPMVMPMPGYWTNAAASGWGGDRLFLLTSKSATGESDAIPSMDDCRAIWFTVWDTPADRDEFMEGYQTHRDVPWRTAIKLGDLGAVYLLGFDQAHREMIVSALQTTPPPLAREDRPWSWWAGPSAQ